MIKWFDLIKKSKLRKNKIVYISNFNIILINVNKVYYAIEDNCPHQDMPISTGKIINNIIICPFHNAQFCVKTGVIKKPLSISNLNVLELKEEGGILKLKINFTC